MIVNRTTVAMLILLLSTPGTAADVAYNAYLGIPLGGGSPYFGINAGLEAGTVPNTDHDLPNAPRMKLDLRYNGKRNLVFSINGFNIRHPLMHHASNKVTLTARKESRHYLAVATFFWAY